MMMMTMVSGNSVFEPSNIWHFFFALIKKHLKCKCLRTNNTERVRNVSQTYESHAGCNLYDLNALNILGAVNILYNLLYLLFKSIGVWDCLKASGSELANKFA